MTFPPCEIAGCDARAEVVDDGLNLCRYHAETCDCGRPLDDPAWWSCSTCRRVPAPVVVGSEVCQ